MRRKVGPRKTPLRVSYQLFKSLIGLIDRIKKCDRIGNMDQNWQAQPATSFPDRIPSWVIDLQQAAGWISVPKPQLLEDFQSARSVSLGFGQLRRNLPAELRLVTGPRGRLVGAAAALPIDMHEDDEAIFGTGPQKLEMSRWGGSQPRVQAGADGDPVAIHQFQVIGQHFRIFTTLECEVGVDVDGGKFGL